MKNTTIKKIINEYSYAITIAIFIFGIIEFIVRDSFKKGLYSMFFDLNLGISPFMSQLAIILILYMIMKTYSKK